MRRRVVIAVVRLSSAVLRLVAEVPAALVQVAPMEVELFNDIFVVPLTLMVHLDGLLEGGAEVAIEGDDVSARAAIGRLAGQVLLRKGSRLSPLHTRRRRAPPVPAGVDHRRQRFQALRAQVNNFGRSANPVKSTQNDSSLRPVLSAQYAVAIDACPPQR